jgi:uncharacterized cupin superfamily protein
MSATPLTILTIDEMERSGDWALARRSLGVSAFGLNVVDVPPGAAIPEHDESERDQEEVFVTLSGDPELVVDGVRNPLPTGSFARVSPEPHRTVRNPGDTPARVLIMSAPRTSGYKPMDWA